MASLRPTLAGLAGVWAFAGAAIALPALPMVNPDVRPLTIALSLLLPVAAAVAAWLIVTGRHVVPAVLLALSVATPTYFAAALNLIPLALAAVLVVQAFRSRAASGGDPVPAASTSARSMAGGRSS